MMEYGHRNVFISSLLVLNVLSLPPSSPTLPLLLAMRDTHFSLQDVPSVSKDGPREWWAQLDNSRLILSQPEPEMGKRVCPHRKYHDKIHITLVQVLNPTLEQSP